MIKQVHITNFKSLADVTVKLDPVTVLIGRSGTGKSNFVSALRFLRDFIVHRTDQFVQPAYGGWERVISATAPGANMSFGLTFEVKGVAGDYRYEVTFGRNSSSAAPLSLSEEKLALDGRTLFHQRGFEWIYEPAIVGVARPDALMLGAVTGIPEVSIAYWALSTGLGCYDFTGLLLPQQARHMVATAEAKPGETGLLDSASNYLQAFAALESNVQALNHWREIVAALRCLNPSVKSVEVQLPGRSRICVSHQVDGRLLLLDFDQESEGFRRFFAHLLALYQSPPKLTLIFEEPEKGIHPGALQGLAEDFKACPGAGRGQVILTTHSPELLNHFSYEMLRVVDMQDHVTRIGPVAPEQVEALREQLLFTGELLTVDAARLPDSLTPAE
jgi:predicted ATPase